MQLIFGMWERCKLPQLGPGEAPDAVDFGAFWTSQNAFGNNNCVAPKQVRLVAGIVTQLGGGTMQLVSPTQTLGGRVPPVPNGLTPLRVGVCTSVNSDFLRLLSSTLRSVLIARLVEGSCKSVCKKNYTSTSQRVNQRDNLINRERRRMGCVQTSTRYCQMIDTCREQRTRKPCCRKETARCRSCSFRFKVRRQKHSLQV